jgi:hypothetical protein
MTSWNGLLKPDTTLSHLSVVDRTFPRPGNQRGFNAFRQQLQLHI